VDGRIKPVSTGFADLDRKMGGGMARGTLIVVAGRPAMGKTAFGLSVARNVSEDGVAAFWSMEMPRKQVMDRNVSAIGRLPLDWVMTPVENDSGSWERLTHAYQRARDMRLFIDEQTSMNMLQIRAKARSVKRKAGQLDCLVIDQLSFITGAESENYAYALGEYTRGLVGLAKDLDVPVILLCQLSRKCDDRPNKRPVLSDLASSGNIEQDAATAIFLYRDEVYNPDSPDKGVCEVIIGKARQGETGMVGLAYIGEQTRFESLARPFQPRAVEKNKGRSLAASL
jgi:replicative DNA helicase